MYNGKCFKWFSYFIVFRETLTSLQSSFNEPLHLLGNHDDEIILPEDYEIEFVQTTSTTDNMPGIDYNIMIQKKILYLV